MQALKSIFGWKLSYGRLLELSEIERLDKRREDRFFEMAKKMSESARFASWFPLRLYRGNIRPRNMERFKVYKASTKRYLKSPLNVMRRKLNEMYAS